MDGYGLAFGHLVLLDFTSHVFLTHIRETFHCAVFFRHFMKIYNILTNRNTIGTQFLSKEEKYILGLPIKVCLREGWGKKKVMQKLSLKILCTKVALHMVLMCDAQWREIQFYTIFFWTIPKLRRLVVWNCLFIITKISLSWCYPSHGGGAGLHEYDLQTTTYILHRLAIISIQCNLDFYRNIIFHDLRFVHLIRLKPSDLIDFELIDYLKDC